MDIININVYSKFGTYEFDPDIVFFDLLQLL